jgi:ABC-type Fe3+ transport system permease subunit
MFDVAEIGIFAITLLRSLIVGALAVAAALPLRTLLADGRLSVRRTAWILLLAPYLTPVLLTGYAYANFSLSLIHHPALNVFFYSVLLWLKFTPIATVILYFTPAPISAEAIHCRRLISKGSKFSDRIFLVRAGCASGPVAAFAIVFLCAFAEFEMASLMVVKSWAVALFDAHAGGLALSESLRRTLGPFLCEAVAITVAFIVLSRQQVVPARRIAGGKSSRRFAWCYLSAAFILILAIPAAMVLWGTIRGLGLLFENFVLTREIAASLLFAAGGSLFAGLLAFWLGTAAGRRRSGSAVCKVILIGAVFTGLLGPLVLSLTVLAAVQLPGLISLRDTPLPLVFTLGLILLPMAMVLKRVLELTRPQSALHLVGLMNRSPAVRELNWRIGISGKFWSIVLLFVWAYWDLTASSILAPIGMTPVTVRLYNLMHYGQIVALSAMACAAFAAPIFVFLLALGTRRWWAPQ